MGGSVVVKLDIMKRILVTGGNKGIGQAIVTKLLQDFPDTYLLLGSRDVTRGEDAIKQIVEKLGEKIRSRLELVHIDVTSDSSVSTAVKTILAKHGSEPLYGLVNNAGGNSDTPRGYLELNSYSVRRVCEAFLPLLQKNKGRIVQISSAAGPSFVSKCSRTNQDIFVNKEVTWAEVEQRFILPFLTVLEDKSLDEEQKKASLANKGLGDSPYGMAKACVNAYTIELSRRNPTLLINACTPGWIQSDLTLPYAKKMGKTPEELGIAPVEKGTVACNYLMMGDLESDITGYQSGRFYGSDAVRSPLHKYRSPGTEPYDGSYP